MLKVCNVYYLKQHSSKRVPFISDNNSQHFLYLKIFSSNIEMSLDNFRILGKLGQGSYSKVYKVQRIVDNSIYALKKVVLRKLSDKQLQNALNQVRILASLNCKYILGYKEAFVQKKSLFIVTDFCLYGDLKQKINYHKRYHTSFSESEIWNVVIHTLKGLKKLHKHNILHRDIKSANIFLAENNIAKIGDFNIAKISQNQFNRTQAGTPFYASPQVWGKRPYDIKSDIWSLGCVFYEMTALKVPFKGATTEQLKNKICSGSLPSFNLDYTKNLKLVIKSMLNSDEKKRPSAERILNFIYEKQISHQNEEVSRKQILLRTIRWSSEGKSITERLPSPKYDRENTEISSILKRKKRKLQTERNESETRVELPKLKKIQSEEMTSGNFRQNIRSTNINRRVLEEIEQQNKRWRSKKKFTKKMME